MSPVKEWTASMRCCTAATGRKESAAAAATSPGKGAGNGGTAEDAASERKPAAASTTGPEEKLRWAAMWAPKGRGMATFWDLERRRRSPEGNSEGCGGAEEQEEQDGSSLRSWWEGRRGESEGWRRRLRWRERLEARLFRVENAIAAASAAGGEIVWDCGESGGQERVNGGRELCHCHLGPVPPFPD